MESAEEGRPLFAPPNIRATFADDGSIIIDSAQPLGDYETHLGEMLRYWATKKPGHLFLAERNQDDEWRRISYAEAALSADALSQSLIDRGLSAQRPVMVLSGNSIDHALLALGSMQIGIPVVPLSPAYSLMSQDFNKLSALFELVTPGLIYVADQGVFSKALDQLPLEGIELVTSGPISGGGATHFNHLVKTASTDEVERAFASVTADSIAKILFTSGSTGMPKGVINTHGMLCSNQKSLALTWPFLEHQPPVLVDWLPWNHTFGGNHNFNMILRNGGTLYIDDGKPAPGLIDKSIKNLKEIAPTLYFNVPAGYNMMLPHLEQDVQLRDRFFEQLQLIFYAAAALPQDLWDRLQAVSIKSRGRTTVLTSAWGSTETAPLATSAHFPLDHAGNIGVPVPGVSLKMVPVESKMELRVKGPNITPGYYRRPDLTDAMFDSEGYYLIGDAGKLINPDKPGDGIEFD
ncbi:MAG: AMP-binding protein, partial [Arenicellales bacterium]|nr:AMP-binding protein [Arenicellales bacterium]